MVMAADERLGNVFAGAVQDWIRVVLWNFLEKTDFPVYTFLNQDVRSGEFKRFRMDIGSVC